MSKRIKRTRLNRVIASSFVDPSFFVRKREEQKAFVQRMWAEESYEKKYKMFDMALKNIFRMLEVEEKNLADFKHIQNTLPSSPREFKGIATVLENICIVGELVLHFPEISYRILEELSGWRTKVEFAGTIVEHYKHVFDQSTVEMLDLFDQEINPEKRTEDFVNPYSSDDGAGPTKKPKKERKVIKKGPALQEL